MPRVITSNEPEPENNNGFGRCSPAFQRSNADENATHHVPVIEPSDPSLSSLPPKVETCDLPIVSSPKPNLTSNLCQFEMSKEKNNFSNDLADKTCQRTTQHASETDKKEKTKENKDKSLSNGTSDKKIAIKSSYQNKSNESAYSPSSTLPKEEQHSCEISRKKKSKISSVRVTADHFQNHDSSTYLLLLRRGGIPPSMKPKKLSDYMFSERYTNGGAFILHAYQQELEQLSKESLNAFVDKFFKSLFRERTKDGLSFSNYSLGVIHGAAHAMPDLLDLMVSHYPQLNVKIGNLERKNDVETVTMVEFSERVRNTYTHGTYRDGPLHQISLVGTKGEEVGNYCQAILKTLEKDPFLKRVMPWGDLSHLHGTDPEDSYDGPILWTRPGEQMVPSVNGAKRSRAKKR